MELSATGDPPAEVCDAKSVDREVSGESTESTIEHINLICSSADLLLVSIDKLTKNVRQVLGDCPQTVNLLLEYLPLIDGIAIQIKNKAVQMKQKVDK
jgi:hypothetical protein